MDKEKLFELAKKVGINIPALENLHSQDAKKAEKLVTDAAKFVGVK